MNKIKLNDNTTLIESRKYKTINLYLLFSFENSPLIKEKVALLSRLIGDISKKYPTKNEMTKAKDMLYGINCNTTYKKTANVITFIIHFSFINPKFVDISIEEYNAFIKEIIFNCVINEDTFLEAKNNIIASLFRKLDEPSYFANERCLEIIGKDNPQFIIYNKNKTFIKNINSIKLDELIETYKYILNKSNLNIYICGDIKPQDAIKLSTYNLDNRDKTKISIKKIKTNNKKTTIDKKDISQSYIKVVYSTPFNKKHKDFFAWFVGNAVFGKLPTSLLFNEIREKKSLCYSIGVEEFTSEGIVIVSTSIDGKNKDKVISEINEQFQKIIKMDYDDSVLNASKNMILNSLDGLEDDFDAFVLYDYNKIIQNFDYTIEEYMKNVSLVTKKDISNVFKKYNHYFNYILLGTKHE